VTEAKRMDRVDVVETDSGTTLCRACIVARRPLAVAVETARGVLYFDRATGRGLGAADGLWVREALS